MLPSFALFILPAIAHVERISLSNPNMERNKQVIESLFESFEKRQTISRIADDDLSLAFGFRGNVSVGTPAQPLTVLFDTGSTQFWVQSIGCTNCVGTGYNHLISSTFVNLNKAAKTIKYVDGTTIRSQMISETVSINNLAQNNYTMNLAVSLNEEMELDGIMGFGFSKDPDTPTFVSQLFQNDNTLAPVFSYFIDKSDVSGAFMIGGIDISRFSGPLATESIMTKENSPFWQLSMNSLEIGASKLTLPDGMASIFDTGSSLAVFSLSMAEEINNKLGIPTLYRQGWHGMPCLNGQIPSGLPDLIMTFGGVRLKFTPQEYIYIHGNRDRQILCISGIHGISKLDQNESIIGNVLLRRYYTVFDMKNRRIGFATCNRQPTTESSIIESDLSSEIVGTANPETVNWEVSSKSTNNAQIRYPLAFYWLIIFSVLIRS